MQDQCKARIYLIRHGETEWNLEGRWQGWQGSILTETGKVQAQSLARQLATLDFVSCYASSSIRAVETAGIILQHKALELQTMDQLREISLGKFEGLKFHEVREQYAEAHHYFCEQPSLYVPVGEGETFWQL